MSELGSYFGLRGVHDLAEIGGGLPTTSSIENDVYKERRLRILKALPLTELVSLSQLYITTSYNYDTVKVHIRDLVDEQLVSKVQVGKRFPKYRITAKGYDYVTEHSKDSQ